MILEPAYEERDKKGQEKAAGRFQKYWEKLNANPKHGPLRIAKWKNEPRYAHTLDGYGLFLVNQRSLRIGRDDQAQLSG